MKQAYGKKKIIIVFLKLKFIWASSVLPFNIAGEAFST